MIFDHYARYYDLVNKEKDYVREVDYLESILKSDSRRKVETILDIGCGTGRHAALLADRGYSVDGIDASENMIALASANTRPGLNFYHVSANELNLDKKYDLVTSLFHVICYQLKNEDLRRFFANAVGHLKPGGMFVFDVWYGPAVLSDPPRVRVKRLEDEEAGITRITEPVMHPNFNTVDVNFEFYALDRTSGSIHNFSELHKVRYFFHPEITEMFSMFKLEQVRFEEWLSGREPGIDTWSVCYAGRLG